MRTHSGVRASLQEQIDFWDGFNVGIEWFLSFDGQSAIGMVLTERGTDVMILDADGSTNSAADVKFDTGGIEI